MLIVFSVMLWFSGFVNGARSSGSLTIQKCCPLQNSITDDFKCPVSFTWQTWTKLLASNLPNQKIFKYGLPDCRRTQLWTIFNKTNDFLTFSETGALRHSHVNDLNQKLVLHDYFTGQYCVDMYTNSANRSDTMIALVCIADKEIDWTNTDFLITRIFDPIFRTFAIIFYLYVAIVYFVMNQLRDLTGNIIVTISLCLAISQAADIIRIFTEFAHHFSFLTAEMVTYTCLLAIFLWINSLGFYIWRTFRSRNVFLRITDARKYCIYSMYVWPTVLFLSAFAIFVHFTLAVPEKKSFKSNIETIDSLGMSIFFVPIALTITANGYFYSKTMVIINRMSVYGRIHHRMKHTLRLFILLTILMTLNWIFLLMATNENFRGLVYAHILMNAVQAPFYFYVCILNQKHVVYVLKKACCYQNCCWKCCRPYDDEQQQYEYEWGEELTAMNPGFY